MIKLNKMEQNEYNAFIVAVVPSLLPGTYHFRDFFTNRVTSARIGRKFYEDVVNGIYPHISLVGTKASEGWSYVKKKYKLNVTNFLLFVDSFN